jgi:hypothetical protein
MSAKGFYICEDGHFCDLIRPVSASAAQTSTRFNMALWAHASIVLRFGASGGPTGAVTVNVFKALTGGSGVSIPFKYFLQNSASAPFDVFNDWVQATSAGFTPGSDVAGQDLVIEIDVDEINADSNGSYVELDVAIGSLGTTAQLLDAFAILSGGRFAGDLSASVQV